VIVVLDAHDVVLAEIAAGLHLDQYRDHRRRAKYRPEVLSRLPRATSGAITMTLPSLVVHGSLEGLEKSADAGALNCFINLIFMKALMARLCRAQARRS
jgi:hypothetical protein